MSGLLKGQRFVAVFPALVRNLGSMESAALLQHVFYRQDGDAEASVSVTEFCQATGLTESTVKRHLRSLIGKGVLLKRRGAGNSPTLYAVVREHPLVTGSECTPEGVKMTPHTSYIEEQESLLPADAGQDEPAEVLPTARDLIASWVDGFRETNSCDPHPAMMQRAVGQCGRLAKTCSSIDEWRRAWAAAKSAGRDGRVDPVPYLAAQTVRAAARGGMGTNVFAHALAADLANQPREIRS